MSKIDTEIVEGIVKSKVKDNKEVIAVLSALKQAIDDAKALKAAQAATESSKLLAVQLENTDSIYILQSKESFDETSLIDLVKHKIAVDFNQSPKGIKNPVANLADVFEFVASKFFKDYELSVKTKTPLNIIHSENKLK